ncbi:SDR family NAD(P)-dependent oxidoreductase [Streptomyces sp. NPDC002596]
MSITSPQHVSRIPYIRNTSPGTSSGFGRLAVERFAAGGRNVVDTVRKDSDPAVHDHLPNVRTLLLDVNGEDADLGFADLAVQQFGRVDALVNNAGSYRAGPLEATTMERAHRQFQTNVLGLIALTKAFIPHFRKQGSGVTGIPPCPPGHGSQLTYGTSSAIRTARPGTVSRRASPRLSTVN